MNRSFFSVILGGFGGAEGTIAAATAANRQIGLAGGCRVPAVERGCVVIVPGYGLAVGRAQHAVKEMAREADRAKASTSGTPFIPSQAGCLDT